MKHEEMKRLLNKREGMKKLMVLLFLSFFTTTLFALSSAQIEKEMNQSMQSALEILADDTLQQEEKAKLLYEMFDPYFNYPLMARLSLGAYWNSLSSEEKKIFTQKFVAKLKNSFMATLTNYSDEVIEIIDLTQVKNRLHLMTVIHSNGGKYEVVYKFHEAKEDDWLIYDMDILGVSIVQSFRNQFAGHTQSFEELLSLLEDSSI